MLQREPNDEGVITSDTASNNRRCAFGPAQLNAPALAVIVRPGGRQRAKNKCFWSAQNREIGAIGLKVLEPGLS